MALEKITIAAARKMRKVTQKELGDNLNVSESTVANWESGKTEPSVTQAYQIAAFLGFEIDDIIFLPKTTV